MSNHLKTLRKHDFFNQSPSPIKRQLDPRLGRWFSPDPVFQPWQSPYTSMDNNPINLNDVLGDKAGDVGGGKGSGGGDKSKGGGARAHGLPTNQQFLPLTTITVKRPSWIMRKWRSFSRFVVSFLEAGDQFVDKHKGDSENEPLGETPMKPFGNSKQEILAVIFETLDGASVNTSDPSVQKAADDALLSYQDADILELSAISQLRGSLNQKSNTKKAAIKRHKHNEVLAKGKMYYKGKFIGEKLRKALDYENALIDAHNKANGFKLTDAQEANMNTVLGLNHSAASDVKTKQSNSEEVKNLSIRYFHTKSGDNSATRHHLLTETITSSEGRVNYLKDIGKSNTHQNPLTEAEYTELLKR